MNKNLIEKFYSELVSDKNFKNKLIKSMSEHKELSEEERVKKVLEEVILPKSQAMGYNFSVNELLEYENQLKNRGELSAEDLENISGGNGARQFAAMGLIGIMTISAAAGVTTQFAGAVGDGSSSAYSQSVDSNSDTKDDFIKGADYNSTEKGSRSFTENKAEKIKVTDTIKNTEDLKENDNKEVKDAQENQKDEAPTIKSSEAKVSKTAKGSKITNFFNSIKSCVNLVKNFFRSKSNQDDVLSKEKLDLKKDESNKKENSSAATTVLKEDSEQKVKSVGKIEQSVATSKSTKKDSVKEEKVEAATKKENDSAATTVAKKEAAEVKSEQKADKEVTAETTNEQKTDELKVPEVPPAPALDLKNDSKENKKTDVKVVAEQKADELKVPEAPPAPTLDLNKKTKAKDNKKTEDNKKETKDTRGGFLDEINKGVKLRHVEESEKKQKTKGEEKQTNLQKMLKANLALRRADIANKEDDVDDDFTFDDEETAAEETQENETIKDVSTDNYKLEKAKESSSSQKGGKVKEIEVKGWSGEDFSKFAEELKAAVSKRDSNSTMKKLNKLENMKKDESNAEIDAIKARISEMQAMDGYDEDEDNTEYEDDWED